MISYAQTSEDVLLARFFAGEPMQPYIDVGAGHPSFHSVTKHFYDLGWSGVNFEPRLKLYQLLLDQRPRDTTLQCAVAQETGWDTFFEVNAPGPANSDNGGLSTLSADIASVHLTRGFRIDEYRVEKVRLDESLERLGIEHISFLKIDVEGRELDVVRSMDWTRWRPRVVVAEGTIPFSSTVCDHETQQYLLSRDYISVFFDGLNRYYVRNEDRERSHLLTYPANVLDGFVAASHFEALNELTSCSAEVAQLKIAVEGLKQQLFEAERVLDDSRKRADRRTVRGRLRQLQSYLQNAHSA